MVLVVHWAASCAVEPHSPMSLLAEYGVQANFWVGSGNQKSWSLKSYFWFDLFIFSFIYDSFPFLFFITVQFFYPLVPVPISFFLSNFVRLEIFFFCSFSIFYTSFWCRFVATVLHSASVNLYTQKSFFTEQVWLVHFNIFR